MLYRSTEAKTSCIPILNSPIPNYLKLPVYAHKGFRCANFKSHCIDYNREERPHGTEEEPATGYWQPAT